MRVLRFLPLSLLTAVLLLTTLAAPVLAQQTAPAPAASPTVVVPATGQGGGQGTGQNVTAEQARQALDVLQNEAKRNQLIQVLQTIANTAGTNTPVASPAPAKPANPAPAPATSAPASPAPASPAPAADNAPLAADSLGAQLMVQGLAWLDDATAQITSSAKTVADVPKLWHWFRTLITDPDTRNTLLDAIWRLAVMVGGALAGEWLLRLLLRRPLGAIEHRATPPSGEMPNPAETVPSDIDPGDVEPSYRPAVPKPGRDLALLKRVPLALLHFLLELLPIVIFAVIGNILLSTPMADVRVVRLAGVAIINAYVICRAISCVVRLFVLSSTSGLRLLPVSDETGAYIEVWTYRVVGTALFGWAMAEMARLLGLSRAGHGTLIKLISLIVHIYIVIIILQCRRAVGEWLRAKPDEHGQTRRGVITAIRNQAAALWHFIAIFLVMAMWVVWAIGVPNAQERLMQFTLTTALVLVIARLVAMALLGGFDRLFKIDVDLEHRFPGLKQRANRYYPLLRGVVTAAAVALTAIALLEAWGMNAIGWFHSGEIGSRLVSAIITIAISALISVAVWEGANIAIDRHMSRLDTRGDFAHAARMRTLVPIMRTILLVIVSVVVVFTFLSEIGVNIAPLLAGASIIGVAVGFGSQKLVQDFITGIFLLLENAMQVGDFITASGLSGTVEKLSIRTIRLRAGDGAVHIIPFSSVGTVTNVNRGVGNAAVKVTVAGKEDIDKVGEVLKQIALEMRADDSFKYMMRSDLQLWGVDAVDGGNATLVGQIVCTDSGRWGVQREFNRRMKKKFDELGIMIAVPVQAVVIRHEGKAADAAAEAEAEVREAEAGTRPGDERKPAGKAARPEDGKGGAEDEAAEEDESATSVRHSPPPSALGHTE